MDELKLIDGQYWFRYKIGTDEFGPWHKIYYRDAMRMLKTWLNGS